MNAISRKKASRHLEEGIAYALCPVKGDGTSFVLDFQI